MVGDKSQTDGRRAGRDSQGVRYFWWKGLSFLFAFTTMTFAASLRGSGNTRLPMYVGIMVNLLNLTGNYLLISGNHGFPQLGTEGAGIATAVARFCGMLVGLPASGERLTLTGSADPVHQGDRRAGDQRLCGAPSQSHFI